MKLYRLLLNLYPARFREEYGGPLQQQFLDDYREADTAGARFKLWLSALGDLAWSIPVELAHELKQDFSHSLRVHARRPFVTTFTIAILALAIGGATGVFSVVNAVLIKALPFRDPGRLVVLSGLNIVGASAAEFHKWRGSSAYLDDAVQALTAEVNIGGVSVPTRVTVAQTSFNFFSALGSEPVIGRAFAPSEDVPGNDGVAVIGYSLWQQLFGGDPRVLGSRLLLNGAPLTIIGVARPGFDYPHKSSVWTPTAFDLTRLPNKGAAWSPFGRLKKGLSLRQAEPMFEADAAHISPLPSWMKDDKLFGPWSLIPLKTDLTENVREASLILMAAVGFVLLIACANVAEPSADSNHGAPWGARDSRRAGRQPRAPGATASVRERASVVHRRRCWNGRGILGGEARDTRAAARAGRTGIRDPRLAGAWIRHRDRHFDRPSIRGRTGPAGSAFAAVGRVGAHARLRTPHCAAAWLADRHASRAHADPARRLGEHGPQFPASPRNRHGL
jgi:MacB-like protein